MSERRIVLTIVMLDTHRTRMAIVFENEHTPYGRRTVQIELTPEQCRHLAPKLLGQDRGEPVFEEIGPVWLEFPQETK